MKKASQNAAARYGVQPYASRGPIGKQVVARVRVVIARVLTSFVLCSGLWQSASAFTPSDADTIINSFNGAFYARDCTGAYYKRDQAGGVSDFWRYAEMIEMQIDVYERTPNAENLARITELLNGFNGRHTTNWSSNSFNDDIMWAVIAHARGYQKTGNSAFRDIAKTNFDLAYARGWDTVGDRVPPVGGFYWNTNRNSKNAATNGPAAIAAYLLYEILGDASYLARANEIFSWSRANLFNAATGQVYDSLSETVPTSYNQGTFVGGANFLGHFEDALRAADFTMTMGSMNPSTGGFRLLPNYDPNTDGGGFNGIGIRWIAKFMKEHGLQSRYLPWLQVNAQAAWNIRRLLDNISWNRTHQLTPTGTNILAWGCSTAVVAMATVPPTESDSLPAAPTTLTATPNIKGIALNWVASSPGYNVKRSTFLGGPYTTIATPTFTSFTDTSVDSDTTYYYVISAVNSAGESADSAEASTRSPHLPDATREAVADALVRAGASANTNFGTATDLLVKLDTNVDLIRDSFLRFDVSGLADVDSVKLRLIVSSVGSDGATTTLAFEFVPDDSWNETGVTWNTKPASSGIVFTTFTGMMLGQTVEVDVTNLVKTEAAGGGLLSMRVYGTVAGSNRVVAFGSKENCDPNVHPVLAYSNSSPPALPPPAPTGLTATSSSAGQITLSWPAMYGVTSYNVKRATVSGGPHAVVATTGSATYTDAAVTNGTPYYYVISALNAFGEGPNSGEASATPFVGTVIVDDGEPACTYVGEWAFSQSTAGYYLIGYRHDGNTGATGGKRATFTPTLFVPGNYEVFVRAPAASNRANNVPIDITHAEGLTTRVVNQQINSNAWVSLGKYVFNAGTDGNVTIRNDGANGFVIADAVRWVLTAPDAPKNLTATPGNAQVALNWTASVGATSYRIKRATVSGGPYAVVATTSSPGYTDTTALNATTYYYVVSAVNAVGEGSDSPSVTVIMPVPPSIAAAPMAQTVTVGDSVTFNVAATGTAPLSYQWRKDGTALDGATDASLVLTNVTTADASNYDVIVSNLAGSQTSAPATLTINKAVATVTLADLNQIYNGSTRSVTITTLPAGLVVNVTYDGNPAAPTIPGSYAVVATVEDANYVGTASGMLVVDITALVRHTPTINGRLDGSLQLLLPESVTLNGNAWVSGDLLVPGMPKVRLNGSPTYAGTLDGNGAATPSNFTITLNGAASLRHVVRRTDAVAMPTVAAPPPPTGTRNVELNNPNDNPGDFTTLRNLTVNGNAGQIAVPPGTYGSFTANGNSGFTLGVAGATEPAVYNLQTLVLNGNSQLQIVGPVVINLATGISLNGTSRSAGPSEWVKFNVSSGGITLNGNAALYGSIVAPAGTVTINGTSHVNGTIKVNRLVINGNGLLSAPAP